MAVCQYDVGDVNDELCVCVAVCCNEVACCSVSVRCWCRPRRAACLGVSVLPYVVVCWV